MRESREEEYIRRMRERGYTPTLAGMDDDDIEWELAKMDGMDPFGEPRPAERPLNPRYKPADPAMVTRIYRQMGRPYDASLIPERERYYLNGGWGDGDEDGYRAENPVRKMPDFGARNGSGNPDILLPGFGPQQGGAKGPYWSIDPLAKGRRPGWGTGGGGPADKQLTTEYGSGREWTGFPSRGVEYSSYGAGPDGQRGGMATAKQSGYGDGGAYGDMLFEVTGVKPMVLGKNATQDPPPDIKLWAYENPDWKNLQPKMKDRTVTFIRDINKEFGTNKTPWITSGYRTPEHNATLQGASSNSWHLKGMGVDINLDDYTAEERAKIEEMARKHFKEVLWHKGTGWHLHIADPIVKEEE